MDIEKRSARDIAPTPGLIAIANQGYRQRGEVDTWCTSQVRENSCGDRKWEIANEIANDVLVVVRSTKERRHPIYCGASWFSHTPARSHLGHLRTVSADS